MDVMFAHNGCYINEGTFEVNGLAYDCRDVLGVVEAGSEKPRQSKWLGLLLLTGGGMAGIASMELVWIVPGVVALSFAVHWLAALVRQLRAPGFLITVQMRSQPQKLVLLFDFPDRAREFCRILRSQCSRYSS